MSQRIRWGIIATGHIARKFADAVRQSESGELTAVGSRTAEAAEAFADEFQIPHRHGSYEALVADDHVDAVYVATPHPMHRDNTLLALGAGKAVLCEKPLSVRAAESREMIAAAREAGLFFMEAMWSRFLPSIREAARLVDSGVIGEPRMILSDFGFRTQWDPQRRALNPDLAGGGLLDVGVYPISLASLFFGRAQAVASQAHLGETGVDEQAAMVLKYDAGRLALLACGVRTETPMEAWLLGTEGKIHLHHPWYRGGPLTRMIKGKDPETITPPTAENGFIYEVEEVGRCLRAGRTESDIMPLDESLAIMETMDDIRAQWGLRYPFE